MLAPLCAAVEASGHDARVLLARANVDAATVENVLARLPRETVFGFVEDAVRTTGDPDLGLHAAELMVRTPGMFGVLEYFTRSLPTVRSGLQIATRYARLLEDDALLELRMAAPVATLSYRHRARVDAPRAWNEMLVIASCLYVRRFVAVEGGTQSASVGIHFAHPRPSELDELRRLFECPLHFDADECAAEFRADLLDGPIRTADAALAGVLEPYANQLLESRPVVLEGREDEVGLVARVRAMLTEELEGGAPTADRIADRVAMSTRTLCRKLSAEGTSFQNVLDGLRHELATKYLRDASVPIADVAGRLGFSSTSAFHHAFRRWTGKAPSDLRPRSVPPPRGS